MEKIVQIKIRTGLEIDKSPVIPNETNRSVNLKIPKETNSGKQENSVKSIIIRLISFICIICKGGKTKDDRVIDSTDEICWDCFSKKQRYVIINGKEVLCDGKICGKGRHAGGKSYICPHYNLKVLNPKLAREWYYEKNNGKKTEEYSYGSSKKVWWKCKNDPCGCHKWKATINNRTRRDNPRGCPYCDRKPCQHNNFTILFLGLVLEYDR